MLEVRDLHVYYGEIHALKGISFSVRQGEIVTLLGNNGAGKTTTLRTLSGLLAARAGDVQLQGASLLGTAPHDVVLKGVTHVPEGRRIFNRLTVVENLEMGAYTRGDSGIGQDMERVYALFPRVKERRQQLAGTLSGGEQQMVAIGRALMARPRLICMDEPSMGLSPAFVDQVFEIIQAINKQGTTIFVVEQNAAMALSIADRGYVLQTGEVVLSGTAKSLLANELVQKAYLGQMEV